MASKMLINAVLSVNLLFCCFIHICLFLSVLCRYNTVIGALYINGSYIYNMNIINKCKWYVNSTNSCVKLYKLYVYS